MLRVTQTIIEEHKYNLIQFHSLIQALSLSVT